MTVRIDTAAQRPIESQSSLTNFQIGQVLRVDDLAVCYAATNKDTNRPLAVAILRRSDPLSLARFRLAAQLGARVSHPGVLPVIAAGRDINYGDYMVTPDGGEQSLDELLVQGAFEPVHAVRIFSQIATVIDALHDQQIIHRDIQPATILVNQDFSVQVTGLGFAACAASRGLVDFDDRDLSSAYYPESQRLGSAVANPSDDLHALGVLLYHMLTGGVTPHVPLMPLARLHADFAAIDRVIRRLVNNNDGQRYANASQAVQALRQAVPGAAAFIPGEASRSVAEVPHGQWDSIAEWLENPLEVLMEAELDSDYLQQSRTRADALHHVDAVRRLLERWARQGMFRRVTFSQFMQPRQILSSNFYLYELRVHYEKRSEPKVNQQIHRAGHIVPQVAINDVWDVPVSAPERFVDVPLVTVKIPGSQQVVKCENCGGSGKSMCVQCNGRGWINQKQKTHNTDGSTEETSREDTCPTCAGYARVKCHGCDGVGNILEEQIFQWARYGKRFFNEDDTTGLHLRTLNAQSQIVYHEDIDLHDPRWRQVVPLRELVDEGLREVSLHIRPVAAELIVKATPVTEVDYEYNKRQHTVTVVGNANMVRGDWAMYDIERILLYATVAVLALAIVVMALVVRN